MEPYELFIPGPVQLSPAVAEALSRPLIPHYGAEWVEGVYQPVLAALKRVFQTTGDVVVLPSSGSGAIESVFCSLADGERTVAIFRNGFFGQRLRNIAGHYFERIVECERPRGEPITAEVAEAFLAEHPDVSIVAMVHGETFTGVANDVKGVAGVVKSSERVLIVDAISTLGAVNVDVDGWEIDLCISASQKGVSAPPGLSFVTVSETGYAFMPPRERIPGWYHNLRVWKEAITEWGAWHPYPVTLPVNLFFALQVALDGILAEGLAGVFARHEATARHVRRRLGEMGCEMFAAPPGGELDTVTAFVLPDRFRSPQLQAYLHDERGMLIAGGPPECKQAASRIGHMGHAARPETMDRVLDAIQEFLGRT